MAADASSGDEDRPGGAPADAHAGTSSASTAPPAAVPLAAAPPAYTRDLEQVLASERDCVRARRAAVAERMVRSHPTLSAQAAAAAVGTFAPGEEPDTLIGLALSGGGIRSAAVCLGALQALDAIVQSSPLGTEQGQFRSADDERPSVLERFDYLSSVSGGGYIAASLSASMSLNGGRFAFRSLLDQAETPAVQHVRDHSNYLFPRKKLLLGTLAIYLRGLVVNLAIVLPWLFLLAVAILLGKPLFLPVLGLALVAFVLWGLVRSFSGARASPDGGSAWPRLFGTAIAAVLALGCLRLSADLVEWLALGTWRQWSLAAIAGVLASLSGIVGFFGPRLTAAVARMAGAQPASVLLARLTGIVLLWVGAAIVPLLLWTVALALALAALPHPAATIPLYLAVWAVGALVGLVQDANGNSLHRLYRDRLSAAFLFDPTRTTGSSKGERLQPVDGFALTDAAAGSLGLKADAAPYHLINAAVNLQGSLYANKRGRNADFFCFSRNYVGSGSTGYVRTEQLAARYPAVDLGTAMAVSGAAFSSNMGANSIAPLTPTLAFLNVRLGYWLANPRTFRRCGRQRAGWLRRRRAIAQFRRGYRCDRKALRGLGLPVHRWNRWLRPVLNFYFLKEAFGLLHENLDAIYVSDGGHIDNLGLFELLRRRCRLILVVDAEADDRYDFRSLITVQRHARIDLGVRIDLPWEAIRRAARAADAGGPATAGPHIAIGRIIYPPGDLPEEGILIYVKSSMTGDENDIIRSYKARWPRYPHETTIDQLFSEEQFEVYRALGFHMLHDGLRDRGRIAVAAADGAFEPDVGRRIVDGIGADHPLLRQARDLLRLPATRPPGGGAPPARASAMGVSGGLLGI